MGGELVGPPDVTIAGVASLDEAGPGDLSFLASSSYLPYFQASRAGAVLVPGAFRTVRGGPGTRIVVADPRGAAQRVLAAFAAPPPWGIAPTARLGRAVRWDGRVAIGDGAELGDGVTLGRDCRIGACAVLGPGVVCGDRVIIETGARVGLPGFGFVRRDAGWDAIPQVGGCRIGDDVAIGANTTVDRGSVGTTRIGSGTKLDNLVHVGHNVRIGRRCLVMAQAGIAGSTTIGDDVIVAGQAGLADNLTVGDGARIAAQSGVIGDIPAGAAVSGYPARAHRAVLRQTAALERLAPLVGALEAIVTPQGKHA